MKHILIGGQHIVGRDAQPLRHGAQQARRVRGGVGIALGFVRDQSAASRQMGSPSLRQKQFKDQRGNCSPGYHLPWPKCASPDGA